MCVVFVAAAVVVAAAAVVVAVVVVLGVVGVVGRQACTGLGFSDGRMLPHPNSIFRRKSVCAMPLRMETQSLWSTKLMSRTGSGVSPRY